MCLIGSGTIPFQQVKETTICFLFGCFLVCFYEHESGEEVLLRGSRYTVWERRRCQVRQVGGPF
jgi:hypothetical protein